VLEDYHTSPYLNIFNFSFILKFGRTSPFLILENSEIYRDLRGFICGPLVLCFIYFSFAFCLFFSVIYSICGPLLLNANMLFNAFFFHCCLNRVNNKRVNKKEKDIEKLFLLHSKFKIS
jgi:hypothetical protein